MATLAINIEPLAAAPTVTVSPPSNAANRLTVSVKRIGPPQNPPDKPLRSILARKINGHSPTRPDGTVIMADDLNDTELFMEFGPLECFTDNANNDSIVYALHTFVATLDGQICVLKGDILTLLDDSNSYWWLVRCVKTLEVGYIPAENIESYGERLARLNKIRNVRIASPNEADVAMLGGADSVYGELSPTSEKKQSINGETELARTIVNAAELQLTPRSEKSFSRRTIQISPDVVAIRHSMDLFADNFRMSPDGRSYSMDYAADGTAGDGVDEDEDEDTLNENAEVGANSTDASKGGKFRLIPKMASELVKKIRDKFFQNNNNNTSKHDSPERTSNDSVIVVDVQSSTAETEQQQRSNVRAVSDGAINVSSAPSGPTKTTEKNSRPWSLVSRGRSKSVDEQLATSESKKKKKTAIVKKSVKIKATTSDPQVSNQSQQQLSSEQTDTSVMVLKIFCGNYDLKATYKTVAVTKDTKVCDVVRMAILKFKVPEMMSTKQSSAMPNTETTPQQQQEQQQQTTNEGDGGKKSVQLTAAIEGLYFLTVVHGDSKQRKLNPEDKIFDILYRLQMKSFIPGVSPNNQREIIQQMRHVNVKGKVSNISTPNDSEIRFLINRLIEEGQSGGSSSIADRILIRVYYHGDDFGTGHVYSVKTLAVNNEDTVESVLGVAVQKFNLNQTNIKRRYSLWESVEQVTQNTDTTLIVKSSTANQSAAVRISLRPSAIIESQRLIGDVVREMLSCGRAGVTSDEISLVLVAIPLDETDITTDSIQEETAKEAPVVKQEDASQQQSNSIAESNRQVLERLMGSTEMTLLLTEDANSSKLATVEDSISLKKLKEQIKQQKSSKECLHDVSEVSSENYIPVSNILDSYEDGSVRSSVAYGENEHEPTAIKPQLDTNKDNAPVM